MIATGRHLAEAATILRHRRDKLMSGAWIRRRTAMLAVAWLASTGACFSASFDCGKAGSHVEKLICAEPLLSLLDETLALNYGSMLTVDVAFRESVASRTAGLARASESMQGCPVPDPLVQRTHRRDLRIRRGRRGAPKLLDGRGRHGAARRREGARFSRLPDH